MMGQGDGYARFFVEDLEEQKRADVYMPECCVAALRQAGHVDTPEMMAFVVQDFGRRGPQGSTAASPSNEERELKLKKSGI